MLSIKYFAWKNYLGQLSESNCLGGNYLEGNYPRVITRGTIIQSPIVRGEFCWMKLSGGSYAGTIIWWAIVRGTIILGDYCPGAIV